MASIRGMPKERSTRQGETTITTRVKAYAFGRSLTIFHEENQQSLIKCPCQSRRFIHIHKFEFLVYNHKKIVQILVKTNNLL